MPLNLLTNSYKARISSIYPYLRIKLRSWIQIEIELIKKYCFPNLFALNAIFKFAFQIVIAFLDRYKC